MSERWNWRLVTLMLIVAFCAAAAMWVGLRFVAGNESTSQGGMNLGPAPSKVVPNETPATLSRTPAKRPAGKPTARKPAVKSTKSQAKPGARVKYVTVLTDHRNIRPRPSASGNRSVRVVGYGSRMATVALVRGQDPYGDGRSYWLKLADGRYMWAGITNAGSVYHTKVVKPLKQKAKALKVHKPHVAAKTVPRKAQLSGAWARVAQCESSGNPRTNTGNGYYGLFQFDLPTWRSVGGSGLPSNASAAEQLHRAKILYSKRGASPWPMCGRYLK